MCIHVLSFVDTSCIYNETFILREVLNIHIHWRFGVFLVRIFPHSDSIRGDTSPYSVRIRENTDQKNSKYGYFSRSDSCICS